MPEAPEIRISSKFINEKCKGLIFNKFYDVEKGNNAILSNIVLSPFTITSDFSGKELKLFLNESIIISIFMGMSGNWKFVDTKDWNKTKYIRMRIDSNCGKSLILYGGYMGPKYKIGGFKSTKRGPDPIKEFDLFKENILNNINKKEFDLPIYELLLNQQYFSGVGNYIRSTILYYLNDYPFVSGREMIIKRPDIIEMSRDIIQKAFDLNGGQLKDWKNPFNTDDTEFNNWVFYKKGMFLKDSNNRTFWYNPKWKRYEKDN